MAFKVSLYLKMKPILILLFLLLIFADNNISAQENLLGAKPKISVNGDVCAIGNQQFSCTPSTCNSVTIDAGDSISFCTYDKIDLTTDTVYYMQWNFNGSSNYSSYTFNYVPTSTPICYYPKWTVAGNYVVDVFYNGWLSAYPWSDCFSYGPSHWIINVTVLLSNGIQETFQNFKINTYPNPAKDYITIETTENKNYIVHIINTLGQKVAEKKFQKKIKVDVSSFGKGLFLVEVCESFPLSHSNGGQKCHTEKILIE